ncbi:hypothetical protein GCM10009674_21090 [Nesterenkonia xinjiangensis]
MPGSATGYDQQAASAVETAKGRLEAEKYAVVVDYFDSSSDEGNYVAQLYRSSQHHGRAELPAVFPGTVLRGRAARTAGRAQSAAEALAGSVSRR